MCRMLSSGTAPNTSQFGRWPVVAMPHTSRKGGQRRYKFEARLGKGRHHGTLYRARCERGELWAIEVVPQEERKLRAGNRRLDSLPLEEATAAAAGAAAPVPLWAGAQGPEEVYTDFKTGARCIVSLLPKESVRERLGRGGAYGVGLVLRWARQLAAAVVGAGDVTLDSLWLDDADCVLVGDFRSSAYAMPPSSSYAYFPESEEEDNGGHDDRGDGAEQGAEEAVAAFVGKQRQRKQQRQQQQQGAEEQEPLAAGPALSEEELKGWGVLVYQLATATAVPAQTTAQAYQMILASSEAKDETSGKQALRAALRARLGDGPAVEPLADLIADALLAKPHLAEGLAGLIPPSDDDSSSGSGVAESISSLRARAEEKVSVPAAEEREDRKLSAASMHQQQQQQQQQQQPEPAEGREGAVSPTLSVASAAAAAAAVASTCPAPLRPILGALRQGRDGKLRQRALYGLAKLGAKAAEAEVVQAVVDIMAGDADPVSRRMAAWALGSLAPAAAQLGAVPPLIRALGDSDGSVRAAAAWALGGMGRACEEKGGLATLLHRSVKDSDPQVREMAAKSLDRLGKAVTLGKRRRGRDDDECGGHHGEETMSSSEDPLSSSDSSASSSSSCPTTSRTDRYYAKRRPISLASTTASMAQASIEEPDGSGVAVAVPVPVYLQMAPISLGVEQQPQQHQHQQKQQAVPQQIYYYVQTAGGSAM